MKKIILCFLSILLLTFQTATAKDIKFAQVTDVFFKESSLPLQKVIQDINKTPDIDFVVFTGNNIGRASVENLKNFLDDVKHLNKPYYIVLGNKDVSKSHNLDKKTYMKTVRKYNPFHPKETNYTFKKGNIVFIVVDGSKELIPTVNGYYNQQTIAWVDKQLTKNAKYKTVIIQHFPLANKPNNEFYYTYNILEYMQMLSRHTNVLAVISGHYNKNDEVTYNGVSHITTPNMGGGVYKIIEIDDDNTVYTMLKDIRQ